MESLNTWLLLALLLLLILGLKRSTHKPNAALPPGPWNLPILGGAHHLLGSLPHRRLRDLSGRYGPMMLLRLGEVSTVVVSSAEAAREIMKTHDLDFATRPIIAAVKIVLYDGKDVVFAPYGHYWRELRKLCILELLSAKRVQSFQSIREEEVLDAVRSIADDAPSRLVNLSKKLLMLTNDITMRAVIGSKCSEQSEFLQSITESLGVSGGFNLADLFPSSRLLGLVTGVEPKMRRCHRKLDRIMEGIILERMKSKSAAAQSRVEEDLLDVLLRLQEEGGLQIPLSMVTIKAVILDMFGAGSETSATTLEWAMSELMRNPRVMKKAQSEVREILGGKAKMGEAEIGGLSYLKLVIKETLRLHPPLPLLLPRVSQGACRVLRYEIPAQTRVMVNAWAIGRDPRYWDDADEFRPERFDGSAVDFKGAHFEFIPFGAGRRVCPGITFGLTNVELVLASLLYYFDWELPDGAEPGELAMDESFGLTARRRSDLCLRAIPRIPCPVA